MRSVELVRFSSASLLALVLAWGTASAQTVIKLGTIAPEGSLWHEVLLEIRERWRTISGGEVELRIYPGGVLGGEDEMIRKMQRRGLDALAVSGAGLPLIDGVVDCLNVPLLFESYEELEHVRNGIAPALEASFERRGYKLLSWAEAGWVHFFAKTPVRTPDDLRRLRLWTSSGDTRAERLARDLGFRVVPLPTTDMLTGLQAGLIEAIDVPPLFALLDRSFQAAPYMTDLQFAPLNAATVVTLSAWESIPARHRDRLLEAAQEGAARLRDQIHRAEEEAIVEMAARGLQVVALDAAALGAWRATAEEAYPRLACSNEHPQIFETARRLLREYRAAGAG